MEALHSPLLDGCTSTKLLMRHALFIRREALIMVKNAPGWNIVGTVAQVRRVLFLLSIESIKLMNMVLFQVRRTCSKKFINAVQLLAVLLYQTHLRNILVVSTATLQVTLMLCTSFLLWVMVKRMDSLSGLLETLGVLLGVNKVSSASAEVLITSQLRVIALGLLPLIPGQIKFGTFQL